MNTCEHIRNAMTAHLDGELIAADEDRFLAHIESCVECAETLEAMEMITGAGSLLEDIHPSPVVIDTLTGFSCSRWLNLLFSAVDRDIEEENLERLLAHLEDCEGCRHTWNDMTLVRQLSLALTPPLGLKKRCTQLRKPVTKTSIMGKRTAVAAAYFLAVLTSLVIGNPVILARNPAAHSVLNAVENVSTGVEVVTSSSKGEFRVMLGRAWHWGSQKASSLHEAIQNITNDNDSNVEQGEQS